ncbi:AAA family ATPase [Actinopolymorpha pittospori]|uniref:Uncharacterized protein n=1 Tax=Actinopolymorpha pittospori TaxID=648752 RepID=A0A927N1C0_9ACTN|nr:hypothetical protein [Actinopolymorpha pittospori]
MIIWLNGTGGVGKTTTANELVKLVPASRIFDAEWVGGMLMRVTDLPRLGDFQHWPPWRHLVVETATQLLNYVGGILVATQPVFVEEYWTEIRSRLEKAGVQVHHVVLHADHDTLVKRIEGDTEENTAFPDSRQWRLDHLAALEGALPWLDQAGDVIDTTHVDAAEVARLIADKYRLL